MKINKLLKYFLTLFVVILVFTACNSDKKETNEGYTKEGANELQTVDEAEKETVDSSASEDGGEISLEEILSEYADAINEKDIVNLVYIEDFTPSDKESGHYRTEFRLPAYEEAIGKSFSYEDANVDLVLRKERYGDDTVLRIYMDGASLENCKNILRAAAPVMDKEITDDVLQETLDYIEEREEANGYYFSNLGLLLLKRRADSYEFMLKMKND